MYDAVIILPHLMEQDGTLGQETKLRADYGVLLACELKCPLVLTGWNYRADTNLCISDAVAAYLKSRYIFNEAQIMIDRRSRDTVGDAIFSKMMIEPFSLHKSVAVVTSDYHSNRASQIFKFVYGPDWSIIFREIKINYDVKVVRREQESLETFRKTFFDIQSGDDYAILYALNARHPFYNGIIYSKLIYDI